MSARFDFIPRLDAAIIDAAQLGEAAMTANGVRFDSLGTEISSDAIAKAKIGPLLAQAWGLDPKGREVQDAAGEFAAGPLERVLGPSGDVVRGGKPRIFVPATGRESAVPYRNELPPGWKINSYEVKSYTGQAAWTEPHAVKQLPTADFLTEKKINGAEYYGIRYRWSIPETWSDAIRKMNSQTERETAATQALDDFREAASSWGDVQKKLPGVFTLGDAILAHGGQRFSAGAVTAVEMMRRLSNFEELYYRINDEMRPSKLIAPRSDMAAMKHTYFGANGEGGTVWSRAIEDFPWIATATWTDRLGITNGVGPSADGLGVRWALLPDDPENFYLEHTETMVFGPFQDHMEFEFVLLRRHGGAVSKKPEEVVYVDFTA